MRLKLLTLAVLLCAILVSATAGTLSSYTTASSYGDVGVNPDTKKIKQQYKDYQDRLLLEQELLEKQNKDDEQNAELMNRAEAGTKSNSGPMQSLEPELGSLPGGFDVLGDKTVNNNDNVNNDEGVVVITGDVTQANEGASLGFGGGNGGNEYGAGTEEDS